MRKISRRLRNKRSSIRNRRTRIRNRPNRMRRQRGGARLPLDIVNAVSERDNNHVPPRYELSFISHGVMAPPDAFVAIPPNIEVITFTPTSPTGSLLQIDSVQVIMESFRRNYHKLIGARWPLINNFLMECNFEGRKNMQRITVYNNAMPRFQLSFKNLEEKNYSLGFFKPDEGKYRATTRQVAAGVLPFDLIRRNAHTTEDLFRIHGNNFTSIDLAEYLNDRFDHNPVRLFLFACQGPAGQEHMDVDELLNPGIINDDGIFINVGEPDASVNISRATSLNTSVASSNYSSNNGSDKNAGVFVNTRRFPPSGLIEFTNRINHIDLQVHRNALKTYSRHVSSDITGELSAALGRVSVSPQPRGSPYGFHPVTDGPPGGAAGGHP